jgi:hypothetical protein
MVEIGDGCRLGDFETDFFGRHGGLLELAQYKSLKRFVAQRTTRQIDGAQR